MRVASLLPSATDTIVALKLSHLLVTRSHECDWEEVANVPICTDSKVGSEMSTSDIDFTMAGSGAALEEAAFMGFQEQALPLLRNGLACYTVDVPRLASYHPDVILTSLQCNAGGVCELGAYEHALEAVLGYRPQVVDLKAADMEGVWRDICRVADALQQPEAGRALVAGLERRMEAARAAGSGRERPRVACIQWPDPWYAAGAWVPQMVHMAGGRDVLGVVERAVPFTPEQLRDAAPDVIVFALCGFALHDSAACAARALEGMRGLWGDLPAVRRGRVVAADGVRLFSRPSHLLVESLEALVEMLHPEAQSYGHEGRSWQLLKPA